MIIRFIGHMCHFIAPPKARVVMFDVPSHEVRLRVLERHTTINTGDPGRVHCWKLTRKIVSFSTIGTTPTTRDLTALLHVPSLNVLGGAGKTVHSDVLTPNPAGAFNVIVELPFGDYGIEDWYRFQATFDGGKTHLCLPRTITFTAQSTAEWNVAGVGNSIDEPDACKPVHGPPTLKPNAEITITNLETELIPPTHYDYHGQLFNPAIVPSRPVEETTKQCDVGSPEPSILRCCDQGQQDLTVECSNTRYP